MLQRWHSGDGCILASTLRKYNLGKGDLFLLSWVELGRVGGVCEMRMCLARAGVCGEEECMRGFGL